MSEEFELLDKTELRIERIELNNANLNAVAEQVAAVLELPTEEVFVIDARDDLLTLDILRTTINADVLVGKEKALIEALNKVDGITTTEHTTICSHGVLGWVMLNAEEALPALDRARTMRDEIAANIAKRGIVFSSGPEVITGQIEDTNAPLIAELLTEQGYAMTKGQDLQDDRNFIAASLNEAVRERGFGLVITTGGVGAENKDHSIEALQTLDPNAATPYLAKFKKGTGRHVKDGIRIGVAQVDHALIIALPGPNDEVRIGMKQLIEGLANGFNKEELAQHIVSALRERWRSKHAHKHNHDH
ncbi:molybdopterin-binding protein [Maricurvus nonylphenolicus]|uniref:molybdopterin-binding protein n=1 Tax=Maricurvus nonylphenolicus TaxID=1008307 RepID=UPI0036F35971